MFNTLISAAAQEALAFALGHAVEAGVAEPAARSLLWAWSERGRWTMRQSRMAWCIVYKRPDAPEPEPEEQPPVPYDDGCPWYYDTRPERQAARGVKSGKVRRWHTRERDRDIVYHRSTLGWSISRIARWFGLARSTVQHLLNRQPPRPRKWLIPISMVGADEPEGICRARLGKGRGRPVRLYRGLLAWLGLWVNRDISEAETIAEGQRLNRTMDRPLNPERVRQTAKAAWKDSLKWRSHDPLTPAPVGA